MTEKANNKDVIYIDVDDEITGIIDKVRGSHSKIVALVLPKRATVLQSIVNMKLLKRSSEEAKKNLVLITAEAGLLPLAGSVGVHVAKSLSSKPEIPDAPARMDSKTEDVSETMDDDDEVADDMPVDKTKPVGELAGATALDDDDTIELDDESVGVADETAKKPKDKRLRIPNFNRFRLIMVLGSAALVALVIFAYFAIAVMPKAAITIKTDSQALTSSSVITLKTAADTKFQAKEGILPAKTQLVQKTLSEEVDATGSQNNGAKATGTIRFYNCNKDDTLSGTNHTLPAGTGVSLNGLAYITTEAAVILPSHFTGNTCKLDVPSNAVGMIAQLPGAKYNQAAGAYKVGGYSFTGEGSATTGGTDDITKIVLQADIDNAAQKIGAQDTTSIKQQLETDLANIDYYAIEETFSAAAPETKTNVNAGDKAESVTVTQTIKYTMLGVKEDDLKKIVAADVSTKIDPKKQSILDHGVAAAVFGVQSQPDGGSVLTMQTQVIAGPDLDADALKKEVAGKKANDAKEIIKQNPGVKEVTVEYSPFWVSSIPGKTSKITLTIEKPHAAKTNDAADASANP